VARKATATGLDLWDIIYLAIWEEAAIDRDHSGGGFGSGGGVRWWLRRRGPSVRWRFRRLVKLNVAMC